MLLAVTLAGAAKYTYEDPVPVTAAEAASIADALVRDEPRSLFAGPEDEFTRLRVITAQGWHYVPYERTYRGMPMIGGDFVVVVDPTGNVRTTSVALTHVVEEVTREPRLTLAEAQRIAAAPERPPATGGELVVYAQGDSSRLTWQINGPNYATYVDALSGDVLDHLEGTPQDWGWPPLNPVCSQVNGVGTGHYNGPNPLPIVFQFCQTTASSSFYWMFDPRYPGLACGTHPNRAIFTNHDGRWGSGILSDPETQCVDAMFGAQTNVKMLRDWLGRDGLDDQGRAMPMYVGAPFNDIVTTTEIEIGHDPYYHRPLTSLDLIGLAMGRGVDQKTPGGVSRKGTSEFIADAFGIATEFYANESEPFDTPDWAIGEMTQDQFHNHIPDWIEGLRRPEYPYSPDFDRCYYPGIEGHSAHMASGIGDYWFFLLANGTDDKYDGLLTLCNGGRSLSGIGLLNAFTILYHAMLMKTSNSSYPAYRLWTVTAAKSLFNYQCETVNRVKAAWDAVNVPQQPGEPVCQVDPKVSKTKLPYPLTDIQPS
jgi:Zn-dependent metalloprotease